MLARAARGTPAAWLGAVRALSTTKEFTIKVPFETHLCTGPATDKVTVTKEELLDYHKRMYTIRRMEITCDTEYKARMIRGFCHLYDGQEAVGMGLQAALAKEDDVIGTYRCHGLQYLRGCDVASIVAELYGYAEGSSKGKGGSMHFYSKKNHFWGGGGIVGAQVPVGAGLAFANKARAQQSGAKEMNICVALYGDGAANQGQIWEAMNMAKLWGLPFVGLCENNRYGMGTSVKRHSCNPDYYKQGGVAIPGVRCDGMDVLAVRECFKWVREYCASGKGPLFVEVQTYRYHGHSMSDPGITYRDREEVAAVRETRDCIELVKSRLLEAGWATPESLKDTERELRAAVDKEFAKAKTGKPPAAGELYTDIYYKELPPFIRGVEIETSVVA